MSMNIEESYIEDAIYYNMHVKRVKKINCPVSWNSNLVKNYETCSCLLPLSLSVTLYFFPSLFLQRIKL